MDQYSVMIPSSQLKHLAACTSATVIQQRPQPTVALAVASK